MARACQGCSSRRTISSPIRAELRPVHPAQVVAAAVVAHGDVLGAADGERARPVVAACRCHAPPSVDRRAARRPRGDHERGGAAEGPADLDQAEGVADPDGHRAHGEAAPHVGAHLVGHLAPPARARCPRARSAAGCPARRGPGPPAAGRRWACGPGWQRELDPGRLPGRDHAAGATVARQRQPVAAAARRPAAVTSGSSEHQHADPGQRRLAQQHRADERGDPGGQEGPPAQGQPAQGLTHAAPGRASRWPVGTGTRGDERGQDVGGGAPVHRGLDARQQPVGEHRGGQGAHVVGQHVVATGDRGARPWPRGPGGAWRAARRRGRGRGCGGWPR